ncbi:MAG: ParB/RepB/Spo0J family partition protein [Sphingobacteriales bacterium]|nr:MAG: ParB/RepB/Spo0J family partition protein [Sphingobacteriales bacterium]
MSEFKMQLLPLDSIVPDPKQPRKFFDPVALAELTESVRKHQVIQPILVRPMPLQGKSGPMYLLVSGERRWRASGAAGRKEIPAVIRELTDTEALELQIIENLQRKDVHPMEEAVAFKMLMEDNQLHYTLEEVAVRASKDIRYVKQRLKFISLTEDWQHLFFRNKVGAADALRIAQLAPIDQGEFYTKMVNVKKLEDPHYFLKLEPHNFDKVRRELNKAPFSKKDPNLNPEMGACTNCRFNSAAAALFAEDEKNPICSYKACFEVKCEAAFKKKLEEVKQDPAIILFYSNDSSADKALFNQLRKEGHELYESYVGCDRYYQTPSKADLASGKVKRAFCIAGYDRGQMVHVTMRKDSKTEKGGIPVSEKIKEGTATPKDIDNEILRLGEREKRNQELDLQKTHTATIAALKGHDVFTAPGGVPLLPYQRADRGIMVFLLCHELAGFKIKSDIDELIPGFPKPAAGVGYQFEYFEALNNVTDDQLAHLVRLICWERFERRNLQFGIGEEDTTLRIIAQYVGVDLQAIEAEQQAEADKRGVRLAAKIEDLKALRSQLKKSPSGSSVVRKKETPATP